MFTYQVLNSGDVCVFNVFLAEVPVAVRNATASTVLLVVFCLLRPAECASDFEGCQSDIFTCDVWIAYQFLRCDSSSTVSVQQPRDQLTRLSRKCLVILSVVTSLDLLVEVLFRDSAEREGSSQQHVE
jgi:hypothetical protein